MRRSQNKDTGRSQMNFDQNVKFYLLRTHIHFPVLGKVAESRKRHRPIRRIRAWQIEVFVTEISANQGFGTFGDWIFVLLNYSFYNKEPISSLWELAGFVERRDLNFYCTKNQPCHPKMMKRVLER